MRHVGLRVVVLCMQTLKAHGFDPRKRDSLPPAIRERYRAQVRGVYRGARKGYKAWRRFERACAKEAQWRDLVVLPVADGSGAGEAFREAVEAVNREIALSLAGSTVITGAS